MTTSVETSTLTSASFEDLVREMIVRLGEDPTREGLARTPNRVRRAYEYLTKGYKEDAEAMLKKALFTVTYDEMVIVKDVEMFSLCEHHMLPFFWQGARGLYSEWQGYRSEQNSPADRNLFASLTDTGKTHHSDCGDYSESHRTAGGGRGNRSAPSLHDDARGGETALGGGYLIHAGLLPG